MTENNHKTMPFDEHKTKTLIFEIQVADNAEPNAVNMAILTITHDRMESLKKKQQLVLYNDINSVETYNCYWPEFIHDDEDDPEAFNNDEESSPYESNLTVCCDSFWFEIMPGKYSDRVESSMLMFDAIESMPYDQDALKIPATYTSVWDDEDEITTGCTINLQSGLLEIEDSGESPTGELTRQYVDYGDEELPVFCDENNDYRLTPSAFNKMVLLHKQSHEDTGPTMR